MKKMTTIFMSAILILGLAACGSNVPAFSQNAGNTTSSQSESSGFSQGREFDSGESETPDSTEEPSVNTDSGALVVYFSVPETTSPDNMNREEEYSTVVIDGEVLGNTQYVAYLIGQNTGGEIFRIEPETPYPMDHAELEAVATKEAREAAMPGIAAQVENMDQYDTVFIGYPNWYADMPRILYSFFEQYDLSGKTIVPFVTSGGSGFSGTISTIQDLEPDATVITDGYSISRTSMEDAEAGVAEWLESLNLSK